MDLEVNVSGLLKEQVGATRRMNLEGPLELEDGSCSDVRGPLLLTRTDRGIWVSGPVAISVDSACRRCLVPFTHWVNVRIDEIFLPTIDVLTGSRVRYAPEEEAESFPIDPHHILDMSEALRQHRVAATPLAPLCREECRGLCQYCGTDLNVTECDCEPEIDPRWAGLREAWETLAAAGSSTQSRRDV